MGFFQRFFSIASRKGKKNGKKSTPPEFDVEFAQPYEQTRRGLQLEQDPEDAASRLLRSSSAHFSVVTELDYTSMPPLPHPINSLTTTPCATPPPRSAAVQRSGTYVVTVHGREVLKPAEFSTPPKPAEDDDAKTPRRRVRRKPVNPKDVPVTPRDKNRLSALRRDPSVASLLNWYDEDGRVSSQAFSNTPPENHIEDRDRGVGREQVKRTGSTLRQLLGEPSSNEHDETFEGDISWAERFLEEGAQSTTSLQSALSATFDMTFNPLLPHPPFHHTTMNNSFSTTHDLSDAMNGSENYPSISSLRVELSSETETSQDSHDGARLADPKTPLPASQVFGFLTEKRKPSAPLAPPPPPEEKPLPPLIPSSTGSTLQSTSSESESLPSRSESPDIAIPLHDDTQLQIFPTSQEAEPDTISMSTILNPAAFDMSSIYDSHQPSVSISKSNSNASSRIPRGPRPPLKSVPTQLQADVKRRMETIEDLSESSDIFTKMPRRPSHRRSEVKELHTNYASTSKLSSTTQNQLGQQRLDVVGQRYDKENTPSPENVPTTRRHIRTIMNTKQLGDLPPMTPMRTRSALQVPDRPSTASSSELSPVARDMMISVREQRMRAREMERRYGRSKSSTGRYRG
ncbi:hypothetical protein JAAARDRAFT_171553 [Jaapia argillacea MUCL 33604]|uniref:Uncharacterized protein n=1 Tax=Jaapia argillacea MUCL 33604 TaxID=933084 RepID=A0A067QFJ5_9AGAM|nr:hypothetical protein JAAARDRAFT_171553 [Jaapia argillacea MUCL 33604]